MLWNVQNWHRNSKCHNGIYTQADRMCLCVDYPDPPTKLELSDPYERSVRLTWVPGDSNFSPITGWEIH